MNERIKELSEQAWDYVMVCDERYSKPSTQLFNEKFAELIVKECAAVQHARFCDHGDVSWDILMEHFGVK